jgi:transcriptional regulator with XRE-family HTH domain
MGLMRLRVALGSVIREVRQARGLTLRDVSLRGTVALGYISEVERGQKEASSEILEQIALALDVPVSDLVIEAGRRMAEHDLGLWYDLDLNELLLPSG